MSTRLILASGSAIRQQMLRQAHVPFEVQTVRIDEAAIRDSMLAEGAPPRDIADRLADLKAAKAASRAAGAFVLGCDQILSLDGEVFAKPATPDDLRAHLGRLNGQRHQLHSAAVLYRDDQPIWRHVGVVRLTMRQNSAEYLDDYAARNWEDVRHCVGGYKLEDEGVRLFHRIEGDYFTVLGLPLFEVLNVLTLHGVIDG